jgi:hypothetical protein
MKQHTLVFFFVLVFTLLGLAVIGQAQKAVPQRETQADMGTAFSYQGQLVRNGKPANGAFEFQFALYDEAEAGSQVGLTLTQVITVENGLFTTPLDFGDDVFAGQARYLQIAVRLRGSLGDHTALSPRQSLTPAPYALYAPQAGAVDWSDVANVPPDIADGDDVGSGGAINVVKAGAGLTGGGTSGTVTLTVAFAGTGSLDAAARSDHDHAGAYAPFGHTHPGSDVTSAVPSATLAFSATQAPWSGIASMPAGFADGVDDVGLTSVAWSDVLSRPAGLDDGDDDTTYTAGVGLAMTGTEMSVDFDTAALLTHTHSFTSPDKLKYLEEQALIPTIGAMDWEFFTIGSDSYLAVANQHNDSTFNVDSKIYLWNGASFSETQSIPTNGAWDWEFFTIGSDSYLVVANRFNGSTYNIDSNIYRWNGVVFTETQSILTYGAADWEFFTIGSDSYLVVANRYNGSAWDVNSVIYQWNGTSFVILQSILTNGAADWEFFTIGNDYYLVVANQYNGSTRNLNSRIYYWNGASFVEFQSIFTNGAMDWEFFTIGSDSYLAVANGHNDSSYSVSSRIYRWNGVNFVEFQSIPTNGARDWEFFTIGNDYYLAVANEFNDSTYNIDSKIYRWNGTGFVESQSIPTNGAIDWESFSIGSDSYLVVANQYNGSTHNIDSKIYKAVLESQAGTSYLWGKSGLDVYYGDGDVGIGTTSPQSALQVGGYVQLDVLSAAPPATDCDEASELGRMKVDVVNDLLYICTNSGWVAK